MGAGTAAAQPSSKMAWTGRIISGIVVLFLLFTTVMGLMHRAESVKHFVEYGYPESAFLPISIVLIVCTLLYAIPHTSVLGAILLVGYLGGATATHVRAGEPFFIPIIVGVVVWLGIFLRDGRLRALVPLRS
jgi:hypothetical protein